MREQRFLDEGRRRWKRLEEVLDDADRHRLSQVDDLVSGYRSATTDLAIARSRGYDARLVAFLDRLVTRAHARIYVAPRLAPWPALRTFFAATFPREVRRSWRAIGSCVAVGALSALLAFGLTLHRPSNAYAFVPAAIVPAVNRSLHDTNFGFDRTYAPAQSALIITNNVRVAAIAFAGGMTAGIVTVGIIVDNGLILGTLAALFARHGFGWDFAATIAPHGVIELSAIHIAGGAGLLLAAALVRPGRRRRADALAHAGRRAATLIGGVAGMLVVAGLIEGFVSPQRLPLATRGGFGAFTAIVLAAYVVMAGRASQPTASHGRDIRVEHGRT